MCVCLYNNEKSFVPSDFVIYVVNPEIVESTHDSKVPRVKHTKNETKFRIEFKV